MLQLEKEGHCVPCSPDCQVTPEKFGFCFQVSNLSTVGLPGSPSRFGCQKLQHDVPVARLNVIIAPLVTVSRRTQKSSQNSKEKLHTAVPCTVVTAEPQPAAKDHTATPSP